MTIAKILHQIKKTAKTAREQGTSFENLCQLFLQKDKTYSPQFTKVQTYAEWAKQQGIPESDIGIDLVATNKNNGKFTAIQCKFYDTNSKIDKKGIDSFISASIGEQFNRRIFFDTTNEGITANVLKQIQQSQGQDFTRIGIDTLEYSSIDWSNYLSNQTITQKPKKSLRPHQKNALDAIERGFETADRGKMIMACGTGKTFTALKIAEHLAGKNKSVLFLAPSLALVSQTITEWTIESEVDLHPFAVCSDTQVGKRKVSEDDITDIDTHDLAYPATTNARTLEHQYSKNNQDKMRVIFATYQSIEVISAAQKKYNIPEFDLIICDEAHRTTGVSIKTLARQDESHFVKIHNQDFIKGKKRLYMTATPRVYITQVKKKADEKGAKLYSMDDEIKFGKELYTLKFGEAVEQKLLSDYKVIVLTLDENKIAQDIQQRFADSDKTLQLDDVTKIIGCYKALSKAGISDTEGSQPMKKAVAFCKSINSSKLFTDEFQNIIEEYLYQEIGEHKEPELYCETDHVDGTMNTAIRTQKLNWLKENEDSKKCYILSNARCLSEGVDVPSLDAILFVHSRKSKIDIVQSVGRVMRKAAGKKLGYVHPARSNSGRR